MSERLKYINRTRDADSYVSLKLLETDLNTLRRFSGGSIENCRVDFRDICYLEGDVPWQVMGDFDMRSSIYDY